MYFFRDKDQKISLNNDVLIYILSFLDKKDIQKLFQLNKEWNKNIAQVLIEKELEIYSPVYVSFDLKKYSIKNIQLWNKLDKAFETETRFFKSKDTLFKTEENLRGCYKIILNWLEILKSTRLSLKDLYGAREPNYWPMSLTKDQIHSYIQCDPANDFIEYKNPHYKSLKS